MARFASGEENEKFDAQIPVDKISEAVSNKFDSSAAVITSSFELFKKSVDDRFQNLNDHFTQELNDTSTKLYKDIDIRTSTLLNYVIPLLVILQMFSRFWVFRLINRFTKWYRIDKETGDVIYYLIMDKHSAIVSEFNISQTIRDHMRE